MRCREWKTQRNKLKRELERKNVAWPRSHRKEDVDKLIGNDKAVAALLVFLNNTQVGRRKDAERREQEWEVRRAGEGLALLDDQSDKQNEA